MPLLSPFIPMIIISLTMLYAAQAGDRLLPTNVVNFVSVIAVSVSAAHSALMLTLILVCFLR